LKILERSGIMSREVIGRVHHCKLKPRTVRAAASWLGAQERFWNAALDRLDIELTGKNHRKRSS
jgi:hypothetical protein